MSFCINCACRAISIVQHRSIRRPRQNKRRNVETHLLLAVFFTGYDGCLELDTLTLLSSLLLPVLTAISFCLSAGGLVARLLSFHSAKDQRSTHCFSVCCFAWGLGREQSSLSLSLPLPPSVFCSLKIETHCGRVSGTAPSGRR